VKGKTMDIYLELVDKTKDMKGNGNYAGIYTEYKYELTEYFNGEKNRRLTNDLYKTAQYLKEKYVYFSDFSDCRIYVDVKNTGILLTEALTKTGLIPISLNSYSVKD